MTERSRPLRTMKVLSDLSPCLKTIRQSGNSNFQPYYAFFCHNQSFFYVLVSPKHNKTVDIKHLHQGHYVFIFSSIEKIPVDSTAGLQSHPVQGEVNLSDKWGHPLHHSVSYIQHHPGLLAHYPENTRKTHMSVVYMGLNLKTSN